VVEVLPTVRAVIRWHSFVHAAAVWSAIFERVTLLEIGSVKS